MMAVLCFSLYCWGKENLREGVFALCCVRLARSQDVGGCEDVILTSNICIVCVCLSLDVLTIVEDIYVCLASRS